MKINQQESIKLYLKIRPPKIIDEPYYSIDETNKIFSLKSREKLRTKENLINLNLNEIFNEENTINEIYNKTCSNVIKESLNGCSYCFINHGETISDKLYMFMGDMDNTENINNNKGIFQYLYLELINYIEQNKREYSNISLQSSFFCINNSKVIDLNNNLKKEEETININVKKIIQNTKLIQNDKSLVNSLKKIPINYSNHNQILSFINNIISEFHKFNIDYFSNSYFSIIIYIGKKIKNDIIPVSSMTFILLNGSEKLNIVNNIKLNKDNNIEDSDLKKRAVIASKNAISTQNNYNSIIYLIKQNKVINIDKIKNKEKETLTKEEIEEIETNEGRYISSLTALLYNVCFDYKIENIKYIIFANIFPNIGYYKSVKDSILFLFDLSKILNKNIKERLNFGKNKNAFETNFMYDLESKIDQQEQTISALSDICQSKNKKISYLENVYNSQITQLQKIFGFDGDIRVLLSGEKSPEVEKAKNIRESGFKIYSLNAKIKRMEKSLKKSKDEIEKLKSEEDIIKKDNNMIRYIEGIKSMREDKLNEMKIKSFFGNKINSLEAELKNKNYIIDQLKHDLDNKNNIIQQFSKFCPKKELKEEEKKENKETNIKNITKNEEEMNNTKISEKRIRKDKKEIEIDKLIKEYEKKIKDEKDFWLAQIDNKKNEIKEMKIKYNKYLEKEKEQEKEMNKYKFELERINEEISNNKRELNSTNKEIMKLNEFLMDIIYNYNFYFIHKSQPKTNFISLKNKIREFNVYITEKEKEINQLNFPLLHILLEKNNKLSTNYKTKIDRNIKLNIKLKKEKSYSNNSNKNSENNKASDNNINIPSYLKSEINLTRAHLEELSTKNLIEYCLILNQRVNDSDKYIEKYLEMKIENEENKKQIEYLNFRLKRVLAESYQIHEINNNNKVIINSQNRTIEQFKKDKLNEMMINDINSLNNFGFSFSPKKTLHFNKSQINLKTYNNNMYNEIYNLERNKRKENKIFLKNKTKNKGINFLKNKKIKELQIPMDYFGLNSDNQTIDTNNYDDFRLMKTNEYKTNKTKKYMTKNEFSASYTNFYSQN